MLPSDGPWQKADPDAAPMVVPRGRTARRAWELPRPVADRRARIGDRP
jgi:hypothetical protein